MAPDRDDRRRCLLSSANQDMREASVFVVDDDEGKVPAKAYFMAAVTGGCILSFSLFLKAEGVRSQYSLQKLGTLRKKRPTMYCTPDFKQQERAMTQLLRWASSSDKKLWSAVGLADVCKNTLCLVSDNHDTEFAQLKRVGGHCLSKSEFVQFLTQNCVDYENSYRVAAAV